jgi:hypothetical protein
MAVLGGTFALALAIVNLLTKLVDKAVVARNGKSKTDPVPPPDLCAGCRDLVMDTSYAMKAVGKLQEEQLRVLGEIRDGVRDLSRTPTGKFNIPFEG